MTEEEKAVILAAKRLHERWPPGQYAAPERIELSDAVHALNEKETTKPLSVEEAEALYARKEHPRGMEAVLAESTRRWRLVLDKRLKDDLHGQGIRDYIWRIIQESGS
jgi:hypothetical protein